MKLKEEQICLQQPFSIIYFSQELVTDHPVHRQVDNPDLRDIFPGLHEDRNSFFRKAWIRRRRPQNRPFLS
jgi:hypothetical protein